MTSSEPGHIEALMARNGADLDKLRTALSGQQRIGLDTESNSMHAFVERICLVQCAWGDSDQPNVAAIDPLSAAFEGSVAAALAPLVAWWSTPGHRVIAHGASYDIAILKRDLGAAPLDLFDTQVAASMLGIEKTGYGSLVEHFLGLTLTKTWQQYDWGCRPIDSGAIAYALDDARHVLTIADRLAERVRAVEIDEEVELACRAVLDTPAHAPRPAAETFWRLATSEGRPPPQPVLLKLKQLIEWRDGVAAELDFPPGRIINNAQLFSLARNPPTDADTWRRKLPRRVSESQLQRLLGLIAAGIAGVELPPRQRMADAPPPIVKAREKHLKRWRDEEARARGIGAQAVLATPTITHLAGTGPDGLETAPQLGESRLQRYRSAIIEILAHPKA